MSRGSAQDEEFDSLLRQVAQLDDLPIGPRLPRPGDIVGDRYRIEERIGAGGMGAVFRATHLVSHKKVAVKWLLRSNADERVRKRFLREARVAGRVEHDNVVDVHDVGEERGCGFLVMELLQGEPLRARLARGPLDLATAVGLLLPAMRGVAAVHRAGIIHRDIKPDNIFLCRAADGTPREAKVLDFGISAVGIRDGEDPTLTGDGAVLGTLAYMSPEQLQRSRDVDARSDVYSFGVVLFEALTGRLPFEADSYPGLALAIVQSEPMPPTELRADLPGEVDHVVLRALAKSRNDRYANIDELITALLPFAGAAGSEAHAAAARAARRKRVRQRARTWSLALCAIAVAFGCAAFWLSDRDVAAPSVRALPARPPEVRATALAPETQAPAAVMPAAIMPANQPQTPAGPAPKVAARRPKRTLDAPAIEPPRSGKLSIDEL